MSNTENPTQFKAMSHNLKICLLFLRNATYHTIRWVHGGWGGGGFSYRDVVDASPETKPVKFEAQK